MKSSKSKSANRTRATQRRVHSKPAGRRNSSAASRRKLEGQLAQERAARLEAERKLEAGQREWAAMNEEVVEAHEAERRTLERANLLISHLPGALIVTRLNGEVTRLNPQAWKLFSLKTEVIVREVLTIHRLIEGLEREGNPVEAANRPRTADQSLYAKALDGRRFPVGVAAQTVTDSEGGQILWLVQDISATVEMDSQRIKLEGELRQKQKLESLGTMAGGIAHELNTPIQFITDNVNFLRDAIAGFKKAVDELGASVPVARAAEVAEACDLAYLGEEAPLAITQSLEGLARVSEIVLAIKRFAHPRSEASENADFNAIIRTAATVARGQWKSVAECKLDLADNLPPVWCNAGEITQVVVNLIVNAAHAIEDKGAKDGLITVSTRLAGDHVALSVSDNGAGMPPAVRAKIFDLFFTTKAPGRGSGQGLSLVHTVITQNHHGSIDVESEVGAGTAFHIRLPLKAAGA